MTRSDVDETMRAFSVPKSIVRTRATDDSAAWCEGDDRDLMHDRWEIRTTNPKEKRNGAHIIHFHSVVGPGGKKLSDDGLLVDALTKRCACLAILNGATGRRRNTATAAFRFSYSFDWHVRFRLSLGLSTNAELREGHWETFLSRLASRDVLDLVPIDSLIEKLIKGLFGRYPDVVGDGQSEGAIRAESSECPAAMSYAMMAAQLGVTATSIFRSERVHSILVQALGEAFVGGSRHGDACDADEDAGFDNVPERIETARSRWSIVQLTDAWRVLSMLSRRGALPHDPIGHHPFGKGQRGVRGMQVPQRPERNPTVSPSLLPCLSERRGDMDA